MLNLPAPIPPNAIDLPPTLSIPIPVEASEKR